MAGRKVQAPRGTFDVLPADAARRAALRGRAEEILGRAGYGIIETPVLESTELFVRGVGESTDVVQKEMFTFDDAGGRSLTLRPENTAGVCRAYAEHGMHKEPQPVKLWYLGPFFRHEAPQAGRYRQFTQIGAEALGSDEPSVDAELILLLVELARAAGARELRLRLSSLGDPETRRAYAAELREFLRPRAGELAPEVVARLDQNPLRAFDSSHEGTRRAVASAPRLIDRLRPEDAAHLDAVRGFLDDAGVAYEIDPTLVRGLDYYTRTVFELESGALGAQSAVGGGGRYDGLVEELGGPPTPGIGWAAGVERILLAADAPVPAPPRPVFVALEDGGAPAAFSLVRRLRAEGLPAQMEQAGRSLKGQLRHAGRLRARAAVIVSASSMVVRDMDSGEQREAGGPDEALELVRAAGA